MSFKPYLDRNRSRKVAELDVAKGLADMNMCMAQHHRHDTSSLTHRVLRCILHRRGQ
jgi:hypothetical protein